MLFFLFVFLLYFSLLSEPYFTDEQDVYYGGYSILKGYDLYRAYLSQHMPFSYYFAALTALCGARTVFQFRLGVYGMLSLCWELIYLRNRRTTRPAALFLMPLIYLALLKTIRIGTTMISDHWQGIGLVIILLELIRYARTRRITGACACMIALGVLLSFGTTFISAYSLFCFFLAAAAVQIRYLREKTDAAEKARRRRQALREDLRLICVCLAPFLVLAGWYAVTGNLKNAWEGVYEVIARYYSKYSGGMGSDPVGVVWETVRNWGAYLLNAAGNLGADPRGSLITLVQAAGLVAFAVSEGRKSPPVGVAALLAAVYSGMRGFGTFHAMAYSALAAAALALLAGGLLDWAGASGGKVRRGLAWGLGAALFAGLTANFAYWGAYNLAYPQPLMRQAPRAEEQLLDLLTDSGDKVHACDIPMYSQEIMNLELIPQENCGAVSYPYFYEMWGDRQMEAIRENPAVVLYQPEEQVDGFVFREYAPDFDAYVRENYTLLYEGEDVWVSKDFLPEAERRLAEAGYGNRAVFTHLGEDPQEAREIQTGETVAQRFAAEGENLTAVYFDAALFYGRRSPVLRIQIADPETGEVLGERILGPGEIADSFYSRCPLRAGLTAGREYEVRITSEPAPGKGSPGIFFAADGRVPLGLEYLDGEAE